MAPCIWLTKFLHTWEKFTRSREKQKVAQIMRVAKTYHTYFEKKVKSCQKNFFDDLSPADFCTCLGELWWSAIFAYQNIEPWMSFCGNTRSCWRIWKTDVVAQKIKNWSIGWERIWNGRTGSKMHRKIAITREYHCKQIVSKTKVSVN